MLLEYTFESKHKYLVGAHFSQGLGMMKVACGTGPLNWSLRRTGSRWPISGVCAVQVRLSPALARGTRTVAQPLHSKEATSPRSWWRS